MESIVLQYGLLGVVALILIKVILIMDNRAQEREKQLRKDYEELKNFSRNQVLDALESNRVVMENCNKILEETVKIMTEVRILLSRFWENKL